MEGLFKKIMLKVTKERLQRKFQNCRVKEENGQIIVIHPAVIDKMKVEVGVEK